METFKICYKSINENLGHPLKLSSTWKGTLSLYKDYIKINSRWDEFKICHVTEISELKVKSIIPEHWLKISYLDANELKNVFIILFKNQGFFRVSNGKEDSQNLKSKLERFMRKQKNPQV